jgi:hypothetical protein
MAGTLLLVNMIPNSLSGETEQDSEPMLAVNPNNPQQIVGTAFTPNPLGGNLAPVYVSIDGGRTWTLNSIVPGGDITGDITVAFGPISNQLYAGILRPTPPYEPTQLNILRTRNFQAATPMSVLVDRRGSDQPFIQAAASGKGTSAKDRVYVGNNDSILRPGKTSTVDFSLSASAAKAAFKNAGIEFRTSDGQNGPQVRPACHSSGVIYVAYYGWRKLTGDFGANTLMVTAEVVVVRDDSGASRPNPFRDLIDPSDSLPGRIVATNVNFPFRSPGVPEEGQQRIIGDISIAVSPADSKVVYLSFCGLDGSVYTMHLRRSIDSGKTWSADLLTVPFGINAGLAVNASGNPGLLYQQLTGSGASARWVTHFRTALGSSPTTWSDSVLCDHPAMQPVKQPDPFLSDYGYLTSQGNSYFGIFSASNEPDLAHFPNGVVYQRNHNFTSKTLTDLAGGAVQISIDPFFFKFTP